jgi:hypothetical protein
MVELHPIEHPATAKWGLPLTYADYNKLLKGFTPQDMDDKWVCVADTPDADGNTAVHLARSWTGNKHISLAVEAGNPKDTDGNAWGKITSITWNSVEPGEVEVPEKEAQQGAVNMCRGLLGCKLENA